MVTTAPLGVIDTLSEGFATVNKRLWLVLLPLVIDLYIGFGPGISVAPIVDDLGQRLQAFTEQQVQQTEGLNPQDIRDAVQQTSEAIARYKDANLLGLIAWQVPNLFSVTEHAGLPPLRGPVLVELNSTGVLLGYMLALLLLGLLAGSVYMTSLADAIRSDVASLAQFVSRVLRGWLRLTVLYGMFLLAGIPIALGLLLLLGISALFGSGGISVVTTLALAGLLTVLFSLFFVEDAIFMVGAAPWRAVRHSFNVIRRNYWSSFTFIVLVNVISSGLPIVWRFIAEHPVGLGAVLLGHAYISTGLLAAGLLFFVQRFAMLQRAPAPTVG